MLETIVKIDLVGSKAVAAANQLKNPGIRKQLLAKLLEISLSKFPQSDLRYPSGSYYKAEGDAVYFIVAKPTVALRACIEFMQSWFSVEMPELERCPDCRIMMDRGEIQTIQTPGEVDLVSPAFENIAVAEKNLQGGRIYVSQDIVANCDRTMARFVSYGVFKPRPNDQMRVYYVEFLDPRTVEDSSLLHALFITHAKAGAARERVLELFILEYLLEKGTLSGANDFNQWASGKSYSTLPEATIHDLCQHSTFISYDILDGKAVYSLTAEGKNELSIAQNDFRKDRAICTEIVNNAIVEVCGTGRATEPYDLPSLIDEYLYAIFSEVRMIANYFRETSHLMDEDPKFLERFDYIIRKHVPFAEGRYFTDWKSGFVKGLKEASATANRYVAAVFHNVLATYYLNRSTKASAYQLDKLSQRSLYIDTNILYALRVNASSYHEEVLYFMDRLKLLGITVHIFPFTIDEYETSLAAVEREVNKNEVSAFLLRWNPWLYQEFRLNSAKYLNNITLCRRLHSITKGQEIAPSSYESLRQELQEYNLLLDVDYAKLSKTETDDLWAKIRQCVPSSKWSLGEYYDFIYESGKSAEKIAHDTTCVYNVSQKAKSAGADELGPKVLFITLDHYLARARKSFPFIVNSEQFLEFMMPYLFLSDIPLQDAEKFPNQLLSAQLGTMLIRRKVEINDLVRGFFANPGAAEKQYRKGELGSLASDIATALSSSRFEEVVQQASELGPAQQGEIANQVTAKIEQIDLEGKKAYFDKQGTEFVKLKAQLAEKDREIGKLRKTVKYFKRHGRDS